VYKGNLVMPTDKTHEASAGVAVSEDGVEFGDLTIPCIDCMKPFIWTAGEQAFFRDKQLQNPPKRCKQCKKAKNQRLAAIEMAQATGIRQRIEVSASCAKCGEVTTIPFYPSQGRPVYCRACYAEMNTKSGLNGSRP
jgi:CxxC-x17-CxxC domain-containing protein